jgi:NAD dependent epimerase/dehydratase family enzyme
VTRRVVLAGASGFIGRYLEHSFRADGADVRLIGRSGPDARWGDTTAITDLLDGADLLINLAGKSVNCRYGPANRAEILRSRVETTRELSNAILASEAPVALWINSSTATIYRHAEDRAMTEAAGEIGEGFSVSVAKAWEAEFFEAALPATRRVALRMAIVLGDGSALLPLLRLARFGLGGAQFDGPWWGSSEKKAAGAFHEYRKSNGHQMFSWIHIADVLGIIRFLESSELSGVVNASAPHPLDNRQVMATLRRIVGAPFGIPAPRPLLEAGSFALRTETELLLKSRWVLPERLLEAGFAFEYPDFEAAVREIIAQKRSVEPRGAIQLS